MRCLFGPAHSPYRKQKIKIQDLNPGINSLLLREGDPWLAPFKGGWRLVSLSTFVIPWVTRALRKSLILVKENCTLRSRNLLNKWQNLSTLRFTLFRKLSLQNGENSKPASHRNRWGAFLASALLFKLDSYLEKF